MNGNVDRPPALVAGVGGSGTRVIAEILRLSGYYMGSDLNESLDNLWFTLLLRRPAWLRRQATRGDAGQRNIDAHLDTFVAAASGTLSPTTPVVARTLRAAADTVWHRHYRPPWVAARTGSLLRATSPRCPWGWKEPNSLILLNRIAQRVPDLHFIHVIRHGFDIALSRNQRQLELWGAYFPIPSALSRERQSFRLWVYLNRRAFNISSHNLPHRHIVVRFEDLCVDPAGQIDSILRFIGINRDAREFAHLVETPQSIGRYRMAIDSFTAEDRRDLEPFGYQV